MLFRRGPHAQKRRFSIGLSEEQANNLTDILFMIIGETIKARFARALVFGAIAALVHYVS